MTERPSDRAYAQAVRELENWPPGDQLSAPSAAVWITRRAREIDAAAPEIAEQNRIESGRLRALRRAVALVHQWRNGTGVHGPSDQMVKKMAEELNTAISSWPGDYNAAAPQRGTCGEPIRPDALTGTTCACAGVQAPDEDALVALFESVYEREWDRAAEEADDRAKAILGPADEHAMRMAVRAVVAAAAAPEGAQGEVAMYQVRPRLGDGSWGEWRETSKRYFDDYEDNETGYPPDRWERRKLYTTPPQPQDAAGWIVGDAQLNLPHFAAAEIQLYGGYEPKVGDRLYLAPQDAAHAIPAGWRLTRVEGDGIAACGPNGGPTVWAHGRSIEARTLWGLADAMLASIPQDAARDREDAP